MQEMTGETFHEPIQITMDEETHCKKCEVGLAIFGLLLGTVFLAISIDVLVKLFRERNDAE